MKTRPYITERLLMGRKDTIKQTNKTVISAPGQTDGHTDEHLMIDKSIFFNSLSSK